MKNAEIGQTIQSKLGIIGDVVKVNENSVIVNVAKHPTDSNFVNKLTVVNHKNYKVVKWSVITYLLANTKETKQFALSLLY